MPIAGRLADMFGRSGVLLVSAALLVLGSVICAVGSSLVPMVVGRAVRVWRWVSSRSRSA